MASITEVVSGQVTIGLDPHPGSHTAVAMNAHGRELDCVTIANEEAAWQELLGWARRFPDRRWAIEGPNSRFARPLADTLLAAGEITFGITPSMTAQYRGRNSRGKDDRIDAANAARALMANDDVPLYHPMPYEVELKELTRSHRRLKGQIKANRMSAKAMSCEATKSALMTAVSALEDAAKALERQMARYAKAIAPELLSRQGVGPVVAATVLAEAGRIERFPDKDHFASYAGSAPLRWDSGAQKSIRVNYRGNRRLNWAAHIVVMGRLRIDPRTQAYRDKKLTEGKTIREVMRCLKTYVCRDFYRVLLDAQSQQLIPSGT